MVVGLPVRVVADPGAIEPLVLAAADHSLYGAAGLNGVSDHSPRTPTVLFHSKPDRSMFLRGSEKRSGHARPLSCGDLRIGEHDSALEFKA